MFRIMNIEEINEKYSRKMGNETIIQVSDYIKNNIVGEYIFIRYMGPKFVIVFSGVDPESAIGFIKNRKQDLEKMNIAQKKENFEEIDIENTGKKKKTSKKSKKPDIINPRLNFVITTYYKGTGMEEVLKKLEQYIDNCDKSESSITTI